ncbi:Inositol polyphosphate 4-phosphatase type II [Haplosporangium gracile]|nr:Inositol polyphosphate 4-phosphatase type II [Haplosporangium gracile]
MKSFDSGILSPPADSGPALSTYDSETLPHHSLDTPGLSTSGFTPQPPVQLRVSIAVDQEQHQEKLVKARLHLVLVLTALIQLPDGRETWVEQCRTEFLSLKKGQLESHFVKVLPLHIQENLLVVGFTLLVVPPPNTSPKVLEAFPALDGLLPWAETSVAIEHFVVGSGDSAHKGVSDNGVRFSAPLMEIPMFPDSGKRRSKHTVATLGVIVGETCPKVPPLKAIAERRRIGPSFSQSYYGHSVRGTPLYGREHLYESPLAFALPIKLLQFLAQDEKRMLEELEKEPSTSLSELIQAVPLDHRPNPITRGVSFMETLRRGATRSSLANRDQVAKSTKARQSGLSEEDSHLQKLLRQQISAHRNIEVYYQNMVAKMEQKLKENIEVGQGAFRRSPEKKDESVQWVPLNCCMQEFLVRDDGYQTNYQTTTAGAAAAHSAGFSRGSGGSRLGKAPSFGAFWDKQEKGFDLKRDFRALQNVLDSCSSEFIALLSSPEIIDRARCLALIKEITFLNSEIVSFSTVLLLEYLTPLSIAGTAHFVCCEIESLVVRLKGVDFGHPGELEQDQTSERFARWLDRCKGLVKEVVRCTMDLRGFIDIAIQHECLITDATLVAGADWMMEKKTRECSFSQLMATMATSFLAILEDWWTNMAPVMQESSPEMRQSGFNGMDFIDEERPSEHEHDVPRDFTRRRSSTFRQLNGLSTKRRPSLRSTLSNASSTSSTTGRLGRSSAKHPLEDFPQVKAHNSVFWDQLVNLGWLVQIESLLTTQGNELDMLFDYVQAIADIRDNVTIGFHMLPQSPPMLPTEQSSTWEATRTAKAEEVEDTTVQISGRRGRITMSFGLDPLQFSLLPEPLKAGTSKIQVYPVFFSQGINEMQTLSNLTGRSPLQQSINEEGLRYMQHYVTRYEAWQSQAQEAASQGHGRIKAGTHGRHTIRRGLAKLSSASLVSNPDSDWDMVAPSSTELWDGESLVAQLLDQLERSVLGHSDETRSASVSGISAASPPDSSDVQLSYPSQSTLNPLESRTLKETESGATSGILGSMMEYGSSRLFSSKGYKNTDILECAEALTRALGQIRMPIAVHTKSPESRTSTNNWASLNHESGPIDAAVEEERPDITESFTTLPLSSLWVTSHVVSCKSAKDRTSMSVTLSQVNILRACHGLEVSNAVQRGGDWQAILDAMRSEIGVRIKNVERNLKLGEFAKDLLWISAFGSPEPQQQVESAFGSTSSARQEPYPPQDMTDALTYVRSLIPQSTQSSSIQGGMVTGYGYGTLDQGSIETSQDSVILFEENVHQASRGDDSNGDLESSGDGVLMEEELNSSDSPAQSITLAPQLPPMKLMRSSTGPALAPVVTLGNDPSQAQGGRRSPLHVSDDQNIHALSTSIPISHLPGPTNHANEGYQSFPGSFDEPLLAVRLARSLGLESLDVASTHHGSTNEPSSQATNVHSPTLPQARAAVRMHRSTPSWSSQQSAYYQQQVTVSTAVLQNKNPPFVKRLSALGLGLGVISKAMDGASSGTSAPQHCHQAIDDFGGPQVSGSRDTLSSHNSSSNSNSDIQNPSSFSSTAPSIATETSHAIPLAKRGKFAFNRYQLKFLPEAYRPPARMATGVMDSLQQEQELLQQEQQQQQQQQEEQEQQQQQQQFQHLSLHPTHDALNHDALSNGSANGSALQTTLAGNASGQLILQHTAPAATGSVLHHHDLSGHHVASHVQQSSHGRSTDSTTTAAAAAAAVAAAATAATLASLESLDSVVAEAVVAASKSAATGSVSSPASTPSVVAVAAIAAEAGLVSSSSSSTAGPSSNMNGSGSSSNSSSNSNANPTASTTNILTQEGNSSASGDRFDKCPAIFRWPADDWETWLEQEKTFCRWNMVRHRHRDKQTFARGPTASEWTREFQCDHAGQYRDRKNPNIDPSKKRKRNGSIKCNCPAFIKMRKQFHENEVLIEYSWRHEGHVPDVMEDIKAQRLPQDLKAWIKERVGEGLDWKTVKNLMNSGSPMLDELHPATKQNIKILLPSCYALFANTSRQIKSKNGPMSITTPGSERATRGGNVLRFEEKTTLAQRLSQPSSPQLAQQSSSSSLGEAHSSIEQKQKQSTDTEESSHAPQTSTWQITLESTQPNDSRQGFTMSDNLHTNTSHDSQTIAVHTLAAPGATHVSTHNHIQHQVLAISEPLLNAESLSRVIREQGTAQDMAALSLVASASLDATNSSQELGSMAGNAAQADHDATVVTASTVATVASMLYNSSRANLQEPGSGTTDTSHQSAVDALMEPSSAMEGVQVHEPRPQAVSVQQQIEQHVQERSPRDLMLEVLRAIADLHKQMEATEQYGTQEDAMEIIESFATPIRLMKEALERRSTGSQP